MDEFERMRQAIREGMPQTKETKPRKRRSVPSSSQTPVAAQSLMMSGGTISGVGLAATGSVVNITHNAPSITKILAHVMPGEEHISLEQ